MTERFTISVPDDVAEDLRRVPNTSAYVTEALRQRKRSQGFREFLREQGYVGDLEITDEGVARMRGRVEALEARKRAKRGQADAA